MNVHKAYNRKLFLSLYFDLIVEYPALMSNFLGYVKCMTVSPKVMNRSLA